MDDNFLNFLIKAKTKGYASGGEISVKKREKDLSKTITFSEGEYKYHDNYFGGEPYGGREVVFLKGKPFWMMVYYGKVFENIDIGVQEIYSFLQDALRTIPRVAPYRGDEHFLKDDFEYINEWKGNINDFSGIETILYKKEKIYGASYLGGLVDVINNV